MRRIVIQLYLDGIYSNIPVSFFICCCRWRNNKTHNKKAEKCSGKYSHSTNNLNAPIKGFAVLLQCCKTTRYAEQFVMPCQKSKKLFVGYKSDFDAGHVGLSGIGIDNLG